MYGSPHTSQVRRSARFDSPRLFFPAARHSGHVFMFRRCADCIALGGGVNVLPHTPQARVVAISAEWTRASSSHHATHARSDSASSHGGLSGELIRDMSRCGTAMDWLQ